MIVLSKLTEKNKAVIAVCTTVFIWGSAFVAIRMGLHGFSPGSLALLRYLVASCAMGFMYWKFFQKQKPTPRELLSIAVLGLVGFTLYNIFLNEGEISLTASASSFVIGQIPVFACFLSMVFLKERIQKKHWLGLIISVIGVSIIASGGIDWHHITNQYTLHFSETLFAAFLASTYAVFQKPLLKRFNPLTFVTYAIWCGTIFLCRYLPDLIQQWPLAPMNAKLSVIYLGLFPAAIAYALWSYGLSKLPASYATCYLYLMPVFASIMGWFALGEHPLITTWIGGFIALYGAWVVHKAQNKKPENKTLHPDSVL